MNNEILVENDPFGGEKINHFSKLENTIGEHIISKLEIPTVFHESKDVIDKELSKGDYDVVLSISSLEVVMTFF